MERLQSVPGVTLKIAGITLIALVGLMHLVLAPEHFEQASYVGALFALNFVGAAIAAVGIYRARLSWGWALGALVAAASFVLYFVTRTVGLPSFQSSEFFEPLGVVALVLEALFLLVFILATGRSASMGNTDKQRAWKR